MADYFPQYTHYKTRYSMSLLQPKDMADMCGRVLYIADFEMDYKFTMDHEGHRADRHLVARLVSCSCKL